MTHSPILRGGLAFAGFLFAVSSAALGQDATNILPIQSLAMGHFGNDAAWYERNIPFFECSDQDVTRVYYYRWQLYKSHLKDLGNRGYIVTEFLDDVSWATSPYQSLDDATAFHINEGRWLKDSRYLDDGIAFMYSGSNHRHFSDAMAAATYGRYLVNGDRAFAVKNLEGMKRLHESWVDHYDAGKGLFHIEPLLDATEYSISSIDASGGQDGFRGGDSFCLEGVSYHGHSVTILFDRFGDRYKKDKGLHVHVDGHQQLKPSPLGRKLIAIPGPRLENTTRPVDIAKAVPKENGENVVTFPPVATSKLRVLFPNPRPAAVALVELKVFE